MSSNRDDTFYDLTKVSRDIVDIKRRIDLLAVSVMRRQRLEQARMDTRDSRWRTYEDDSADGGWCAFASKEDSQSESRK